MMSDCRETVLQLTEYAAGNLPATAASEVARHLDRCPACRQDLALENELRATLGSLPMAACPPGTGSITGKPTISRTARPSRWAAGVGLLAAAGLAALLIGGVTNRTVDPDPTAAWSSQEIAAARQDILFTLALTADALERTQRKAVVEVFGERLPRAVNGSLKMKTQQQGDEG